MCFCEHDRLFPFFFRPLAICFLWAAHVTSASGLDAPNVLVLYNGDAGPAGDGFQIAAHYAQARPGVHLLPISGIDSILSGSTSEEVSADGYLSVIRPQVLSAINGITDSIDVIVTTKGMPLRIDAGSQPAGSTSFSWKRYSSLESELTRIDSINSLDKMGDQFFFAGFPQFDTSLGSNPYYNSGGPFVRLGSDPINGDIRLASRLDGYSVASVNAAIDRAQKVFVVPQGQYVVADDDPTAGVDQLADGGGPGPGLKNVLTNANQAFVYENNDTATTTAPGPVLGYVSHGTNDGTGGLESGYIQNQLQFDLANGAVFLTHESFNALSFDPAHAQSQGLIAEWLEAGGTAGLGHVQEPYNGHDNVTNEDLLFEMLLPANGALPGESGLTFVEAAWNATRQLSYVNTVVGDPLMKFQAWLPGDINLDGTVNLFDVAILQDNWQEWGTFAQGDVNGDGIVNLFDVAILQDNWQMQIGSASAPLAGEGVLVLDPDTGMPVVVGSIPEPSTLLGFSVFLLVGLFCTARGRNR